jgi:hypothetical protein
MEKIALIFILLSGSFQGTNALEDLCLAKSDVEKILGSPAQQTESQTFNNKGVIQHKCTWKATKEDLNSNLYYIGEQYDNAEAAHKVFTDIVTSNTGSGQSRPDIGDEAWLHSDGTNFIIIIVRKGDKMIRMKVNKLTKETSIDEMKRIASAWQ